MITTKAGGGKLDEESHLIAHEAATLSSIPTFTPGFSASSLLFRPWFPCIFASLYLGIFSFFSLSCFQSSLFLSRLLTSPVTAPLLLPFLRPPVLPYVPCLRPSVCPCLPFILPLEIRVSQRIDSPIIHSVNVGMT